MSDKKSNKPKDTQGKPSRRNGDLLLEKDILGNFYTKPGDITMVECDIKLKIHRKHLTEKGIRYIKSLLGLYGGRDENTITIYITVNANRRGLPGKTFQSGRIAKIVLYRHTPLDNIKEAAIMLLIGPCTEKNKKQRESLISNIGFEWITPHFRLSMDECFVVSDYTDKDVSFINMFWKNSRLITAEEVWITKHLYAKRHKLRLGSMSINGNTKRKRKLEPNQYNQYNLGCVYTKACKIMKYGLSVIGGRSCREPVSISEQKGGGYNILSRQTKGNNDGKAYKVYTSGLYMHMSSLYAYICGSYNSLLND